MSYTEKRERNLEKGDTNLLKKQGLFWPPLLS